MVSDAWTDEPDAMGGFLRVDEELGRRPAEYGVDQEEYAINANMRNAYRSDLLRARENAAVAIWSRSPKRVIWVAGVDDLESLRVSGTARPARKDFTNTYINYWFAAGWGSEGVWRRR